MATSVHPPDTQPATTPDGDSATAWVGVGAAVALIAAAMVIPRMADWDVHLLSVPPLHADWDPRAGPGTLPAVAIALLTGGYAVQAARALAWHRLLLASYVAGVGWLAALATVDGWAGIGAVLDTDNEYLDTARSVDSVSHMLHEFGSRIPLSSPDNWPVHVAGHPPGALLSFVALVSLGLGSGLAAGWVVVLIAASTPVAVLVTLRRLGAETSARLAAPFLVVGPAAVWMAVSADAMFGAVAAWGVCCLAVAATSPRRRLVVWSIASGLLLGYCVMMSYGLPLLVVLALAVMNAARCWAPLPWALGAAVAVVLAFAVAGFAWWEAYPVLRERYWDGVAKDRPMGYWAWANLAALCIGAGPIVGAAVSLVCRRSAAMVRSTRRSSAGALADVDGSSVARTVVLLAGAAITMVVIADLSAMSKAEVERIWLPFVPWLLVATALLPGHLMRPGLALQLATALVVQHLLLTGW